ncbi:hypothetical protein GWK48_09300 [Metallosphaera tengchongensis]|uniref:Uncharacterized protein n=1 Tax=Metallosphaera tengchongensis TaxID=1532350 RepID=A0A6N0NWF7_9CREN|nr:hypothetical protein [Metallosphaera tengchongensis]QKR00547.1 hypothetical protein GWK48_09300 [Metallosphaera tengchongensis]
MIGGLKDRLTEATLKFDRAKVILKVALDIVDERGRSEVGDFDYRTLVARLYELGHSFEPKMILRALERDYGIIETSYKSSNQHWWRFIDVDEVRDFLGQEEEDPDVMLIKAQAASLSLDELERKLITLQQRGMRSDMDKAIFRKIAFEDLPLLVEIYKKSIQYEETKNISMKVKKILTLASKLTRINNAKNNNKGLPEKEREGENNDVNSLRLLDG